MLRACNPAFVLSALLALVMIFGTTPQALASEPASQAIVVTRAVSQVGTPYAWGGGNSLGPSQGLRDGGVSDTYGDYTKVGYDCGGLMQYAFAGVGLTLPHFTGAQYRYGHKVSLQHLLPGDMVFYGPGGRDHVALYIGGGRVVEAPESGASVRVSPLDRSGATGVRVL